VPDFPRGWTITANAAAGATASITVPAVPNVAHVLDTLTLRAVNASAALYAVNVTVQGGILGFVMDAFPNSTDEISLTGIDLATAPGNALTITFSGVAPASTAQQIYAQGHDI
jgi:hypothetical protein